MFRAIEGRVSKEKRLFLYLEQSTVDFRERRVRSAEQVERVRVDSSTARKFAESRANEANILEESLNEPSELFPF